MKLRITNYALDFIKAKIIYNCLTNANFLFKLKILCVTNSFVSNVDQSRLTYAEKLYCINAKQHTALLKLEDDTLYI